MRDLHSFWGGRRRQFDGHRETGRKMEKETEMKAVDSACKSESHEEELDSQTFIHCNYHLPQLEGNFYLSPSALWNKSVLFL